MEEEYMYKIDKIPGTGLTRLGLKAVGTPCLVPTLAWEANRVLHRRSSSLNFSFRRNDIITFDLPLDILQEVIYGWEVNSPRHALLSGCVSILEL